MVSYSNLTQLLLKLQHYRQSVIHFNNALILTLVFMLFFILISIFFPLYLYIHILFDLMFYFYSYFCALLTVLSLMKYVLWFELLMDIAL